MIDTRCYNCAPDPEYFDGEPHDDTLVEMEYKGEGRFVCPECGNVLDLSNDTYKITIQRVYDENGELYSRELEVDPRLLDRLKKSDFIADMIDFEVFEHLPIGKYKLEVLWYYYQCGGEEPDWDVEIDILSEEELK